MSVNDTSLANLKPYAGTWKHGQTRTIRVPSALAFDVMCYARQIDEDYESRVNEDHESRDTRDLKHEVSRLKAENEALRLELVVATQTDPATLSDTSSPEIELPGPWDILSKLRAERKKTKADEGDIKAILRIIEKSW